uniref:uncharacterized protein LOC120338000 n=1 Tax=Styela clava TaxID=7725 RepID=UPI00193933DC|nr:uncharacterized protein LOC120338000 [Styela clava]
MDFQNQEGTMVELACDGDRISFTWKITYGVTGYSLLVRNAKDRNPLVIHEKFSAGDCRYEVNMNERLRYGQVCEVKLQTYGPGEEFQESDWNVFVIGGPTVAINPTAEINIMNPRRSAIVNWMNHRRSRITMKSCYTKYRKSLENKTCLFSRES